MKHDYFFEDLNPECQKMLAHKVDGEHPAGYPDLLLAAQKLEGQAETRDPLPLKTAATSGLNMTCIQMLGNIFPSHKLKGNCTFTTQASDHQQWQGWGRFQCKAGRIRRDRAFGWWRGQSIRQSRGNRSVYGVYHLLCQGGWVIPKEEQKLFWAWESWSPCMRLPKRHWQICLETRFKHERGDSRGRET